MPASTVDLTRYFPAFASPRSPMDDGFLNTLMGAYGREILAYLVAHHGSRLPVALTSFLERASREDLPFDLVWDAAFGEALGVLARPSQEDLVAVAVNLALRLHLYGFEGDWRLDTGGLSLFRVGRYVLPPVREMQVRCRDGALCIDGEAGQAVTLPCISTARIEMTPSDLGTLPSAGGFDLLTDPRLRPLVDEKNRLLQDAEEVAAVVDQVQQALDWLEALEPAFVRWVRRVLRYVVPVAAPEGAFVSAGKRLRFGVVQLSRAPHVEAMAESLVHEAAHQHFHILERLGPVDDGSDPKTYFSPPVQANRAPRFILLAHHAFGNVILLARSALRGGCSYPDYWRKNLDLLLKDQEGLRAPLVGNAALTDIGRVLFETLEGDLRHVQDF